MKWLTVTSLSFQIVAFGGLRLLLSCRITDAWSAEWIALPSSLQPPRSGHVAFTLDNSIYIFGGYAEEDSEGEVKRYSTNDLWKWEGEGWKCVQAPDLWTNDNSMNPHQIPQQRLAAAAASLPGTAFVLGGWDSQQPGTGGVILNDIACLQNHKDNVQWSSDADVNLGAPTSRLIAVSISESTILVHNHRCTDSVILVTKGKDLMDIQYTCTTQPTTGIPPSPRGLHAATYLPNQVVIFGGAAQSGEMSNQVYTLDTQTWEWKELKINGPQPSPRASPCFCSLDDSTCILFGGADRSLEEQGVFLHGCDDLWLLHVHQARWEQLTPTSNVIPPGRNAATLTPIPNRQGKDGSVAFLLTGGWYPFRSTHSQIFLLQLEREGSS